MARRHQGGARQRRNVERLRVVAVHPVAGAAQPDRGPPASRSPASHGGWRSVRRVRAPRQPAGRPTPRLRGRRVTPDRLGRSSGVRPVTEASDTAVDGTAFRQVPIFAHPRQLWEARRASGFRPERSGGQSAHPTTPELPAGIRRGGEPRVPDGVVTVRRLSRVPVQGPGAPTVVAPEPAIVVAPGSAVPVAACDYEVRDPYAVFLEIHVGLDQPMRTLAGSCWRPACGSGRESVTCRSTRGRVGGRVPLSSSSAVRAVGPCCEPGAATSGASCGGPSGSSRSGRNGSRFDLDLLLCRLLRHPDPSRAESCGCRSRRSTAG